MSNLDKTGKKLIDSIRKTKKGPATAAVKSATKKTKARIATKPKKSPVTSKSKPDATKAKSSKGKPTKVKATTKISPKVSTRPIHSPAKLKKQPRKKSIPVVDIPFQDGSQVWPD